LDSTKSRFAFRRFTRKQAGIILTITTPKVLWLYTKLTQQNTTLTVMCKNKGSEPWTPTVSRWQREKAPREKAYDKTTKQSL
jgi:hypothetical protein